MITAELGAELLPEEFLGPRGSRVTRLPERLDARLVVARGFLLLRRDDPLLPHRGEHRMAALEGAVIVGPRRQGRRRLDQPGYQCGLRKRQRARRLAEQVLRHRFHAVPPAAQVDTIEVQLEDLLLRELLLEEERNPRFLGLATERPHVRQEERACELLGDGTATLAPPAAPDSVQNART